MKGGGITQLTVDVTSDPGCRVWPASVYLMAGWVVVAAWRAIEALPAGAERDAWLDSIREQVGGEVALLRLLAEDAEGRLCALRT